jgi:hypothetical protein
MRQRRSARSFAPEVDTPLPIHTTQPFTGHSGFEFSDTEYHLCWRNTDMPITVKSIVLWRKEIENQPGTLASTLEPFAGGGADLQVVMGYRYPGNKTKAAIELYPVTGRKFAAAAEAGGLKTSAIPTLLVQGDNKPGLGHAMAQSLADAKINLDFFVAQVIGRRYSAVIGFESTDDAKKAAAVIKKTAISKRK